jgi:uncharacterized protein YecE (DUF72 family)
LNNTGGKILFGTCGWSYKEWIGPFYAKTDKSMLRAYTHIFNSAEIDSTFYRYPNAGTVMGWARYSPEGFVFTAKLPGLITHDKKLNQEMGIEKDLDRFLQLMEPLSMSGKLGCVLVQLPPRFDYKPKQVEEFFRLLPTHLRFAVEFRHPSWLRDETWRLLERYKVAYTIVDEPLLPPEVHVTSDIAYFRWHGRGTRPWYDYRYSAEELQPWISRIQAVAEKVKKVYGYFNNHYHGYAVENCLQIMEMIGSIEPKQTEVKRKLENYRKLERRETQPTLTAFATPKTTDFPNLVRYFVSSERLRRAEEIPDSELKITTQKNDLIEAAVREYHITINQKERILLHDCADWQKISSTKKLCKHVAKLLLFIDRQAATVLLKNLFEEEESWSFGVYPQ